MFRAVSFGLLLLVSPGILAEPVFFQHRMQDPLNLLGAIPALSAPGHSALQWQLAFSHANVFSGGREQNADNEERLIMDGELSELELRGQWRISQCLTAALDSRLVAHNAGVMDDFISEWHRFFGLPNANRDAVPSNQLNHQFSVGGQARPATTDHSSVHTNLQTPGAALGDLWLSIQRPTRCGLETSSSHWRVGVKAPIGKAEQWTSGGQWALFADWHSKPKMITSGSRVTASIGASYSTDWDERFAALSPRSFIGYGAMVFDYQISSRWQSLVQLDIRSPVFHSRLVEIGSWGAQLHVGARAKLGARQHLEVSFSEDLLIDTAPDVGFRIAFSQHF